MLDGHNLFCREVVGVGTPIELLIQPSCVVGAASLLETPLITGRYTDFESFLELSILNTV